MKSNVRQGFQFVLLGQVLVLLLGLAKAFFIPIFLSVEHFAYWQIYVFYVAYVGLFTIGFNDGIYLRYGGINYSDLPADRIRSSVRLYSLFLIGVTVLLLWICTLETDPDKRLVLYFASGNVLVMGLMAVFSFALQATGRLKRFSVLNAIDKILFLVFVIAAFVVGAKSFLYFIVFELVSKLVTLAFMIGSCRDLVVGGRTDWTVSLEESRSNIASGIKLMIANVSGMLVLGVGRIIVEYSGDIESYGFYAFGVSMTNLALIAIAALSIVVYPVLKRLPPAGYVEFYNQTNRKLFVFNLLMLCGYFPVVWLISNAMPQYSPVIEYLNFLFAVTVLQGKMQLLNNNYYKALRLEGAMLVANLISLIIAVVLSIILYMTFSSLLSIALAALLTMAYRVFMSERYLRKAMGDSGYGIIRLELAALLIFIVITGWLDFWVALPAFTVVLCAYALYARRDFLGLVRFAFKDSQ